MGSNGNQITVLYKIVNSDCDKNDSLYNAFRMSRGQRGPTLSAVKQNCSALFGLNHLGPEGYHWRVCVEDKGSDEEKSFTWWDIQDENAVLPVKQATQYALTKFFAPPGTKSSSSSSADPTAAAKGALKSFGKAMSHAVAGSESDHGPPASVIAFKLVDVVKMHDEFAAKHSGRGGHIPVAMPQSAPASRPAASSRAPASAPRQQQQHQQQQHRAQQPAAPSAPARRAAKQASQPSGNLMDFGDSPSSSAGFGGGSASGANLSKVQKTQEKYQKQKQKQNLVWDDIEQRYVQAGTIDKKGSGVAEASAMRKKKEIGISLDATSAVGKSANVQAAVNKRVNDMRKSQKEALQQLREVEDKKKKDEAEEDVARKKLEPKIKAWSEEYGKKKQLRALLATLHTILWPGAKWKTISIGDIMQDSKVKRAYLKATLVVHPDKTHHLPAEQRFLAKRIFDALSQAKKDFDEGK